MSAPKHPDTPRLDWLLRNGYAPAEWRAAHRREIRAGLAGSNGLIFVSKGTRKTIDKAMKLRAQEDQT